MQPNDLGLDEFDEMCKLLDVEPYISVNAGFGDSHSAAEEVEYMNGAASTYMGAKRAKNGHAEPYHVKFWNIGNEPWGPWQLGRTDTKYFVLKHNEFAKAMREVDLHIDDLIASGEMLEEAAVVSKQPSARSRVPQCWGPLVRRCRVERERVERLRGQLRRAWRSVGTRRPVCTSTWTKRKHSLRCKLRITEKM